jgi:hypothetical protein
MTAARRRAGCRHARGALVVKARDLRQPRPVGSPCSELVLMQEDVSRLARAEAELRRHRDHLEDLVGLRTREIRVQRAKLQNILDGIPGGVAYWSADGVIEFANEGHAEWVGLPVSIRSSAGARRIVLAPAHLATHGAAGLRRAARATGGRGELDFASTPCLRPPPCGTALRAGPPGRQASSASSCWPSTSPSWCWPRMRPTPPTWPSRAFLANMSHEIRTPLNAIAGMAHLMRRAGPAPEQLATAGQAAGARASTCSTSWMPSSSCPRSRPASSTWRSGRCRVDIAARRRGRACWRSGQQAKGLQLSIERPHHAASAVGDATRLRRPC